MRKYAKKKEVDSFACSHAPCNIRSKSNIRSKATEVGKMELSGVHAMSGKINFPECHKINPLLTKLILSRWFDIGLFFSVYGPPLCLSIDTHKKNLANIHPS